MYVSIMLECWYKTKHPRHEAQLFKTKEERREQRAKLKQDQVFDLGSTIKQFKGPKHKAQPRDHLSLTQSVKNMIKWSSINILN